MNLEIRPGKFKVAAIVPVIALVVAGCGGSKSSSDSGSKSYSTPQEIAAKIDCANPESAPQVLAREGVDCDFDGGSVEIVTFNDNGQRDQWHQIAAKVGGGVDVLGDKWLVSADTTEQAQRIQSVLGGKVS